MLTPEERIQSLCVPNAQAYWNNTFVPSLVSFDFSVSLFFFILFALLFISWQFPLVAIQYQDDGWWVCKTRKKKKWRVRFFSYGAEKLKLKKQECQFCSTRFETIELPATTIFSVIIRLMGRFACRGNRDMFVTERTTNNEEYTAISNCSRHEEASWLTIFYMITASMR